MSHFHKIRFRFVVMLAIAVVAVTAVACGSTSEDAALDQSTDDFSAEQSGGSRGAAGSLGPAGPAGPAGRPCSGNRNTCAATHHSDSWYSLRSPRRWFAMGGT